MPVHAPVQRCSILPVETELQHGHHGHRLPLVCIPPCRAVPAGCGGVRSGVAAAGCLQLCVFGSALTQLCVWVSSHPALSTMSGSCNRNDKSQGYSSTLAVGREQKGYLYRETGLNVPHHRFILRLQSRGHQNNINGNNNIW